MKSKKELLDDMFFLNKPLRFLFLCQPLEVFCFPFLFNNQSVLLNIDKKLDFFSSILLLEEGGGKNVASRIRKSLDENLSSLKYALYITKLPKFQMECNNAVYENHLK